MNGVGQKLDYLRGSIPIWSYFYYGRPLFSVLLLLPDFFPNPLPYPFNPLSFLRSVLPTLFSDNFIILQRILDKLNKLISDSDSDSDTSHPKRIMSKTDKPIIFTSTRN